MTSSVHRENARRVRRGLTVLVRPCSLVYPFPPSSTSPPPPPPPLDCFSPLLASGGKKKKKKRKKKNRKREWKEKNKGSSTTQARGTRFGTIRLAFRIVGHCLFVNSLPRNFRVFEGSRSS